MKYDWLFLFLAILLLLIVPLGVYFPGLSGGFIFDDIGNILANPALHLNQFSWESIKTAALSGDAGPLRRPVSVVSFAVNHIFTGLDPWYFKLSNLIIHICTGISLFILNLLLLDIIRQRIQPALKHIQWISLAIAAAWLLHPFNLTGVLYIVQRMTSLAALFTIWGLICYCLGRKHIGFTQASSLNCSNKGVLWILIGLFVFGGLAALSKENGILLVLLIFITEWLLFGFQTPDIRSRRWLIGLTLVIAVIPTLMVGFYYLVLHLDSLAASYASRDFSLSERVLTQGRVIWFYIQMILQPDLRQMGLHHDDIPFSTSLLQPISTLIALLGLLGLLLTSYLLRHKAPVLGFSILFFLVGHGLESTVFPLEMVYEHRNYLPSFGLLFGLFYYLLHPKTLRASLTIRRLLPAMAGILIIFFAIATAIRAQTWASDLKLALAAVEHHPTSARSYLYAGMTLMTQAQREVELGHFEAGEHAFNASRELLAQVWKYDDNRLGGAFAYLELDVRQGKSEPEVLLTRLYKRLEHGTLQIASINILKVISMKVCHHTSMLKPKTMARLLASTLKNPGLSGNYRKELQAWLLRVRELGVRK